MIADKELFYKNADKLRNTDGWRAPICFGICKVDMGQVNITKVLQAKYLTMNYKSNYDFFATLCDVGNIIIPDDAAEIVIPITEELVVNSLNVFEVFKDEPVGNSYLNRNVVENNFQIIQAIKAIYDYMNNSNESDIENGNVNYSDYKLVAIFENKSVESVEAAYLRLVMEARLSENYNVDLYMPSNTLDMLPEVAWISGMPIELEYLRQNNMAYNVSGIPVDISHIGKLPHINFHVLPDDAKKILNWGIIL